MENTGLALLLFQIIHKAKLNRKAFDKVFNSDSDYWYFSMFMSFSHMTFVCLFAMESTFPSFGHSKEKAVRATILIFHCLKPMDSLTYSPNLTFSGLIVFALCPHPAPLPGPLSVMSAVTKIYLSGVREPRGVQPNHSFPFRGSGPPKHMT